MFSISPDKSLLCRNILKIRLTITLPECKITAILTQVKDSAIAYSRMQGQGGKA
jgi:hypothetical protein